MMWVKNIKARKAKRRAIGERSFVAKSVKVNGWKWVKVGADSLVCDDCWIVCNHDHDSVIIGDHCFIGARNFFTAGRRIEIGDFTLTAQGCQFLGASHDYSDPMVPHLAAKVSSEGLIRVGVNCAIGGGAILLADANVGHGSIVGAGSVVKGFVPPFSLVVGNPARVIKRYDPLVGGWVSPDQHSSASEEALPIEPEYRAALRNAFPRLRGFPGFISKDYGDI